VRIRDIVITGEPVLHRPCARVEHIDDHLKELVQDMFATMELAPGVGLAAPQVGVDLALFVYDWVDEDDVQHRGVAINPTLIRWSPHRLAPLDEDDELEGCLSVPGERFPLRRSDRVTLTATNLDGNEFTVHAEGWLARIFQHEFDHVLGVLDVDRLVEPHLAEARDAINHIGVGCSWFLVVTGPRPSRRSNPPTPMREARPATAAAASTTTINGARIRNNTALTTSAATLASTTIALPVAAVWVTTSDASSATVRRSLIR